MLANRGREMKGGRFPRWILGVAVCCVIFGIGCLIYTEYDMKRFEAGLGELPSVGESSLSDTSEGVGVVTEPATGSTGADVSEPESPKTAYDWLTDDPAPTTGAGDADPLMAWWEAELEGSGAEVEEDTEVYPPTDWYKTTDPVLFNEYFLAQLINQFGDVPQVHILAAGDLKIVLKIPMTLDEKLEHSEAMYDLFPDEGTLEGIKLLRELKASGHPFEMADGSEVYQDPFPDIEPFLRRYGWVDGIERFREIDPERAAEFERAAVEGKL